MAVTRTLVPVEKLYTKAEAAEQLNVPLRFVERCVSQRRVRVIRLGRHIRIPESALAELMTVGNSPARPVHSPEEQAMTHMRRRRRQTGVTTRLPNQYTYGKFAHHPRVVRDGIR